MSTSKVPSVINPDIPPPPSPKVTAPSGDRSLSPDNSAGAPNKRTRTVSNDDMEVEPTASTTTTTSGPVFGLVPIVPAGLPVSKVQVIAQPQQHIVNAPLFTSIPSLPLRFHAAAYLHDAPVAFKEKFTTNRTMCDEVDRALSRYSSYGSRARCEGSDDNKRILVSFFVQEDHSACIQSPCADLLDLVFTPYSPADARRSDKEKSLFVTDIPLFLNETQIRQAFSRYGTVVKCKLTTRNHYYNAHIQFADVSSVTQFDDIWAIICLGNSLRVCLASFPKSQRDSRREHVAILAGIPKNIKEADLLEIASHVNAKAVNIPLSYNSYKSKPYAYFNFASFENLEAAKELTIAFRGKGLSWHSPKEARELCHVCSRHGCSPSKCSPRPAKKTNDRLDKLYSRFNAGPKRGRSDSRHARSSSGSRSRSRSNSRSRNRRPSNQTNDTAQSGPSSSSTSGPSKPSRRPPTHPQNNNKVKDINPQNVSSNSGSAPPSSSRDVPSIPPDVINEIRQQILAISQQLQSLDVRVEALEYSITDYTYRIGELEAMMNYDDPSPPHNESSYETYTQQDCSNPSLMDESPDASFSALDPKSVLSRRHIHLPEREVSLKNWTLSLPRTQPLLLNELQQFYDGWISGTSKGPHPPDSAINNNISPNPPSSTQYFDISPNQFDRKLNFSNILQIGTLNVRSLVHASKQFNLFSLLLSHQLHGLILTETNLQSPSHKYVCEPYLSQYNYHKWFSFSSSVNHHAGVGILLHSSLAMYVIKKRFHKDRLISLLLQLPGRQNLLIIGAYIPPDSGLSSKLIAECHSTLISWITSARATGTHVLLGGDLNANFDSFIKHVSDDNIRTPSHTLFKFLFTHQFDDLCALDPSTSLPLPTFTSASSGQLSRLDYLWTSPDFLATHLWSHVEDTLDNFNSDHMLLISFFDFLSIRDMRAPSYLKQRSRYRTVYNFHAALPDQKVLFTSAVDASLKSTHISDTSNNLNRIWHGLKTALLNAARSAFPKQVISLNKTKKSPVELQPYQHIKHKLDHFIRSLRRIFTISELYGSWNHFYFSFCPLFLELFSDRKDLINEFPVPDSLYSVFISSNLPFISFLNKFKSLLRSTQRLIAAKLKLEFDKFKQNAMKAAIAERNANFYEDKGRFI
ncbi:hypothetical protein RhiirA4_475607 [Rhizophagus irregularis]|uniref:RRM domain-containing protein n=1 Tax=Rhizophagus irregularis TaxID=588596 RepID=A0A2I1HAC8_9GLOM|nr:hypothetical protein RhiirA4_475607 [Rhizophagus irregularis]